jgi:hypothetical protein
MKKVLIVLAAVLLIVAGRHMLQKGQHDARMFELIEILSQSGDLAANQRYLAELDTLLPQNAIIRSKFEYLRDQATAPRDPAKESKVLLQSLAGGDLKIALRLQ